MATFDEDVAIHGASTPLTIRAAGKTQETIHIEASDGAPKWSISQNALTPDSGFTVITHGFHLDDKTGAGGKLFITHGGNVGIGTVHPQTALHIPERGLQIGVETQNPEKNFHWASDVNGPRGLRLYGGNYGAGVHLMTVLPNGNVGIGAADPLQKLHVAGWSVFGGSNWGSSSADGDIFQIEAAQGQTGLCTLRFDQAALRFWNPLWGELARLTKDGRLGIGTSAPVQKLHVTGWTIVGGSTYAAGGADGNIFQIEADGRTDLCTLRFDQAALRFWNPQAGEIVRLTREGNIVAAGDIVLQNADCAEEFAVAGSLPVEPGTVMVLDEQGALRRSMEAYDRKVAGVVSGAGDLRPAIVLDNKPDESNRVPIALVGKTYCRVDARLAPIEAGDLLTTSTTPGHAMKATDPLRSFGAILGKALRPLRAETGLIPILVTLQ